MKDNQNKTITKTSSVPHIQFAARESIQEPTPTAATIDNMTNTVSTSYNDR